MDLGKWMELLGFLLNVFLGRGEMESISFAAFLSITSFPLRLFFNFLLPLLIICDDIFRKGDFNHKIKYGVCGL